MTSFEIQTITDELTPVIKNLPHSRNFDAINFVNQKNVFLGRETFTLNGSKNYLFPITYNASTKEYTFPLNDTSLPIHLLLAADADLINNQQTSVSYAGLTKIFSHLGDRADILIQEGELVNTKQSVDDYVFLYFAMAFITETPLKKHALEHAVIDWLNTGMCLDRILFFLRLNNPEYSPDTITELKCMPLDEII